MVEEVKTPPRLVRAAHSIAWHVNEKFNSAWREEPVITESGRTILEPGDRSYPAPTVFDNWQDTGVAAVAWEDGPDEWCYSYLNDFDDERDDLHKRLNVFCEPYFSFIMLVCEPL